MFEIGQIYSRGGTGDRSNRTNSGRRLNQRKSFDWVSKAADLGLARAIESQGKFYLYGWGLERDNKKAACLFEKAANKGDPLAKAMLGECYTTGIGVKCTPVKGVELLVEAATEK